MENIIIEDNNLFEEIETGMAYVSCPSCGKIIGKIKEEYNNEPLTADNTVEIQCPYCQSACIVREEGEYETE